MQGIKNNTDVNLVITNPSDETQNNTSLEIDTGLLHIVRNDEPLWKDMID